MSVLPLQIVLRDPTGHRASTSDINGDAVLDDLLQHLRQGWHGDGHHRARDVVLHHVRGLARQEDLGLVASLSRPGGNVTGITQMNVEIGPKLLETLCKAVPNATSIALLINPANPNANVLSNELRSAAQTLGVQLHVVNARAPGDLETAFASLAQLRAGGLVIGGDPFLNSLRHQLAALALRYRVPSIYQSRLYPEAGGLMSYGGDAREAYRQAGTYAGRILKGARPADLAVQQVTRVELVINLKTANALGLTVPQSLLAGADEVIE